jgi:hypothetical protein
VKCKVSLADGNPSLSRLFGAQEKHALNYTDFPPTVAEQHKANIARLLSRPPRHRGHIKAMGKSIRVWQAADGGWGMGFLDSVLPPTMPGAIWYATRFSWVSIRLAFRNMTTVKVITVRQAHLRAKTSWNFYLFLAWHLTNLLNTRLRTCQLDH